MGMDGEHAPDYIEDPDASIARYALPKSVWVHGQLVPKDQLAAFLKQPSAVPCKWRPAFRRGGCE